MPIRLSGTDYNRKGAGRTLAAPSARELLFELLHHAIEVGVAGTKAPREPIPAPRGNRLTVRNHVKLPGLAGHQHRFRFQPLLNEGHETRDLGLIVLSSRAVHDFDFHGLPSAWWNSESNLNTNGYGELYHPCDFRGLLANRPEESLATQRNAPAQDKNKG